MKKVRRDVLMQMKKEAKKAITEHATNLDKPTKQALIDLLCNFGEYILERYSMEYTTYILHKANKEIKK